MLDVNALVSYLAELEANNNKPWFEQNKPRFQAMRSDFADVVQEVILVLAEQDERLEGLQADKCLFRIHRDVRFSKDKWLYTLCNLSNGQVESLLL